MSDRLFADVHPRPASDGRDDAPPRYETANREQIELQPCDLESLLPPGHAARLVWRFVEGLDLSAFYATIRAREGRAGRPPIDPKILVALWLYATMDGVGSAREVERLCYRHDAYRWLRACGFAGRIAFLTGHARSHPLVEQAHRLGDALVHEKPISAETLRSMLAGAAVAPGQPGP